MRRPTTTNWLSYAVVIGVSAAIGFAAVYAIVGGGNKPDTAPIKVAGGEVSGGAVQSEGKPDGKSQARSGADATGDNNGGGLTNMAAAEPEGGRKSARASGGAGQALKGADGRPLNRGDMVTFVFKKQPEKPAKSPVFNGPDGQKMTIADFEGKVVLLNLWATWCAPCRKEMPYLDQLQRELGSDQFEVVALSVDRGSPEKARAFLAEVGAKNLRFFHDPQARAGFALKAIGMPTTLLFDRQGREIGRLVGPAEWHSPDAKALIEAAIAAG